MTEQLTALAVPRVYYNTTGKLSGRRKGVVGITPVIKDTSGTCSNHHGNRCQNRVLVLMDEKLHAGLVSVVLFKNSLRLQRHHQVKTGIKK